MHYEFLSIVFHVNGMYENSSDRWNAPRLRIARILGALEPFDIPRLSCRCVDLAPLCRREELVHIMESAALNNPTFFQAETWIHVFCRYLCQNPFVIYVHVPPRSDVPSLKKNIHVVRGCKQLGSS